MASPPLHVRCLRSFHVTIRLLNGHEQRRRIPTTMLPPKKAMKQFITLGALALAWAVLQTVLFSARPLEKLTLVQAQALPNAIWIDARNPLEYSQEHIPGALNLPLRDALQGTIPQQLRDTDKSLVIYCDGVTCGASDRVAEILSKTLHARIYVLPGGFPEWKAAR